MRTGAPSPTPATPSLDFDAELRPGQFVQTPTAFLRSPAFSPTVKLLYQVLLSYKGKNADAWPGQDRLAADVGVSERTVRGALATLETAGLITVQKGGDGQTNRYHFPNLNPVAALETQSRPANSAELIPVQTGKKRQSRPANSAGKVYTEKHIQSGGGDVVAKTVAETAPNAPLAAAANTHKEMRGATVPVTQPDGPQSPTAPVPLLDLATADLARLTPEEGLRRFRAEGHETEATRAKFAEIANRPGIRSPRVVQWREAQVMLAERREARDREAARAVAAPTPLPPPAYTDQWLADYEAGMARKQAERFAVAPPPEDLPADVAARIARIAARGAGTGAFIGATA